MKNTKGLNRDTIKYIAIITMVLNHVATIFLPEFTLAHEILVDLGYFAAPVMCFFLVEGYHHTKDVKKYHNRLLLFALISQIPFDLAFTEAGIYSFTRVNMIGTLYVCFHIVDIYEKMAPGAGRNILIFALIICTIPFDWAVLAPMYTLLFAVNKRKNSEPIRVFAIMSVLMYGLSMFNCINVLGFAMGYSLLISLGRVAGLLIPGLVINYLYNGKKSQRFSLFSRFAFYIFYPVHLLILGLIRIFA